MAATTPQPISQPAVAYGTAIANATGLSLATVMAWIRAEGGLSATSVGTQRNNFLNIMIPGTQTVQTYASPAAGAAAVIANLRTPRYASVLSVAASTNDPKVELAAIADSPWDHEVGRPDVGPKPKYLHLLLGSLVANAADFGAIVGVQGGGIDLNPIDAVGGVVGAVGGAVGGAVVDATLGPAEQFVKEKAATGLAYVVLVMLGFVFVVFGLLEIFGVSPKDVATGSLAGAGGGAAGEGAAGEGAAGEGIGAAELLAA
jgi:hypothetical protein